MFHHLSFSIYLPVLRSIHVVYLVCSSRKVRGHRSALDATPHALQRRVRQQRGALRGAHRGAPQPRRAAVGGLRRGADATRGAASTRHVFGAFGPLSNTLGKSSRAFGVPNGRRAGRSASCYGQRYWKPCRVGAQEVRPMRF